MVGKAARRSPTARRETQVTMTHLFVVVHFLKDHHTMAEFCTNCGAPLSGLFCGRCGHRAQSASASAQPAPTAQPVIAPTAQPVAPAPPQPAFQQPTSTQPPITQLAATAPKSPAI